MAIDASRFGEITTQMHILWSGRKFFFIDSSNDYVTKGPFQLIVALVLLYRQMQLAIVPGVILLLIMIPINLGLQRIQKVLTVGSIRSKTSFSLCHFIEAKQMVVKDSRIKIMNEILNGVRVLKLYAWEQAFINSVDQIRKKELRYIRQKAIISSISNILWTFTPILVRFFKIHL